jgi:hypothetical protein
VAQRLEEQQQEVEEQRESQRVAERGAGRAAVIATVAATANEAAAGGGRRAVPKAGRGGSRRGRVGGTEQRPCRLHGATRTRGRASRGTV